MRTRTREVAHAGGLLSGWSPGACCGAAGPGGAAQAARRVGAGQRAQRLGGPAPRRAAAAAASSSAAARHAELEDLDVRDDRSSPPRAGGRPQIHFSISAPDASVITSTLRRGGGRRARRRLGNMSRRRRRGSRNCGASRAPLLRHVHCALHADAFPHAGARSFRAVLSSPHPPHPH